MKDNPSETIPKPNLSKQQYTKVIGQSLIRIMPNGKQKKIQIIKPDHAVYTIQIFDPGPINCQKEIEGVVSCCGTPIPNITVQLTASTQTIQFEESTTVTNEEGIFTTRLKVKPNTTIRPIKIIATSELNGRQFSNSLLLLAGSHNNQNLNIDLNIPHKIIKEGEISGILYNDNTPIKNGTIFLESDHHHILFLPNPVITDEQGNFKINIFSNDNLKEIKFQAKTFINEHEELFGPYQIEVDSTEFTPNCHIKLETIQDNQPGAIIRVNQFDQESILVGSLTIHFDYNKSLSNTNSFQYTFHASNGDIYHFTLERLIEFTSLENNIHLSGIFSLSHNNGPTTTTKANIKVDLDSESNLFSLEFRAENNKCFTIETLKPFLALATSDSFIGNCMT